jgi:hypothetical protein
MMALVQARDQLRGRVGSTSCRPFPQIKDF